MRTRHIENTLHDGRPRWPFLIPRLWRPTLSIVFALCLALLVRGAAAAERADWAVAPAEEQAAVRSLLGSRDWPFRVFGLLRLERYEPAGVAAMVADALDDESWQVRCFALRQATRMRLPIDAAVYAEEGDGRVVRMALRCGVSLDAKAVAKLANRLMRLVSLEERLLGIEIAAATNDKPLRKEATQRLELILRNMDELVAQVASRRLAVVLHAVPPPESLEQWRTWFTAKNGEFALAPPEMFQRAIIDAPASRVAAMDSQTIMRLRDYLDGLKQRDLEMALVMDATASMIPMVNEARAAADGLILFLQDLSKSFRLAFIAYRDHDNQPVWDGVPLTSDVMRIRRYLFDLRITGGADLPEAVYEGLAACTQLDWSPKATKQIVLIGDARPHPDDGYRISELLNAMLDRQIVVHAAHIPMRVAEQHRVRMHEAQLREIEDHNTMTATAFQEIAETGGGRKVHLDKAADLVPAVMRFTIDETWWEVFDEFYAMYLDACR